MANYRVAKRYAKAFIEILPTDKMETAVSEMKNLSSLLKESRELRNFMSSPIISNEKKTNACQELFQSFSQESKTLIDLLIKNERSNALKEVAEQVLNLYRQKKGIKKAIITSAQALDEAQIKAIVAKTEQSFSGDVSVEVEQKINKDLIGGFVLRVDDQQYDASLRSKLNHIKQEFDTNHTITKI